MDVRWPRTGKCGILLTGQGLKDAARLLHEAPYLPRYRCSQRSAPRSDPDRVLWIEMRRTPGRTDLS